MPIQYNNHHHLTMPYGLTNYCDMRSRFFNDKVSELKNKKLKPLEWLQFLATPKIEKTNNAFNWDMNPLTITTLTIVSMNANSGETLQVLGSAPKLYSNQILKLKSVWKNPETQIIETVSKVQVSEAFDLNFKNGFSNWAKAQAELDKKNIHLGFHHIQLAIDYFAETPEQIIVKFFFLCLRYIHHKNSRDLGVLILEFKALHDLLPPYLQDHSNLFIFRIELLLFKKSDITENDFENEALKKIFLFEQKLRPFSLKLLRKLMIIRMDMLDILYPYFKILS